MEFKNNTEISLKFNSVGSFSQYLNSHKTNTLFNGRDLSSQRSTGYDKNFTGTSSFEEANKLMVNGWSVKAAKLNQILKTKPKQVPVQHSRMQYSVVGFQASVPRYIQGIPQNMFDKHVETKKEKIVVINKDISYNCSYTTDQIEEYSVRALQIIQRIEATGKRVELNVIWGDTSKYFGGFGQDVYVKVCIKHPNERLNISKMAFPLVHPSFLRRMMFRFLEVCPEIHDREFLDGYGHPMDIEDISKYFHNEICLSRDIDDVDFEVKRINNMK